MHTCANAHTGQDDKEAMVRFREAQPELDFYTNRDKKKKQADAGGA
jgi:hypothetical protein